MSRKDVLAAGAHKAAFAGGIGENDIFRNVAKEDETTEVVVPAFTPAPEPRFRYVPRRDTILVRRLEKEASSVLITSTIDKEKPAQGIVLERGPASDLVVGTHVVFGKYSGQEFKLNGEVLLILQDEEISGTLQPELPIAEA